MSNLVVGCVVALATALSCAGSNTTNLGGGSGGSAAASGGAGGSGGSSGGSSGSTAGERPASASDVAAMCQALCDHKQRCSGSTSTSCLSDCQQRMGTPEVLSQLALQLAADCYRDPACLDDDTCEGRALTRDPSIVPMINQCVTYLGGCPQELDISLCLRAGMMIPELRAQWASCTTGTCTSSNLTCP